MKKNNAKIQKNTHKETLWVNAVRLTGILFAVSLIWNLNWAISNINHSSFFTTIYGYIFVFAITLITIGGLVMVINRWNFKFKRPLKFLEDKEKPLVATLIPTYEEPVDMVINTAKSVIEQDWPKEKMVIVVSDDARNPELEKAILKLRKTTGADIHYVLPHAKDHPQRKGESKAGNLNYAFDFINQNYPKIEFIETRDADDLVGTKNFLSYCLRSLTDDRELSFVQTIKETQTTKGDPFHNMATVFYRRIMPSRLAANAAFPCGTGLVWRKSELEKIGGFPAWNLVEDLQSGYEILRKGGKGEYLYTVGTVAQISPEDIPNHFKQRGTWAIDTLRLFFFKNPLFVKGFSLRQKLQFFELQFAYVQSFSFLIFAISLATTLGLGVSPVDSTSLSFLISLAFLTVAMELYYLAEIWGISYKEQLLARQTWLGLSPVFVAAFFQALFNGPNRKPAYKVTRKFHQHAWYWKETLVQKIIILMLSLSIIGSILRLTPDQVTTNILLWAWSIILIYGFSQTVINSWHGLNVRERALKRVTTLNPIKIKSSYTIPILVLIIISTIAGSLYSISSNTDSQIDILRNTSTTTYRSANQELSSDNYKFIAFNDDILAVHRVVYGETLWYLATTYYNEGSKWIFIRDKNTDKISFLPNGEQALISHDTELIIPKLEEQTEALATN
ncbi:MAG: hypothetical protein COV34_01670 [Candidatus Zambryskibacteria bacterium CG10_big_fil_rev_8_21_14_0_10_42_12]|uniref:Glycosyltransferase 2-like domain-containing protein n=1 Tax=Candidatus Zambryskibacteria bacterium CG10_big_fil_rev_8_21_14_0_10_42_12 TaxID=1975115 RepID=A0A2H0QVN0_9BACT|nr:MAG: hypothetical protein COV34_01670 [Candidatus Zambryskibacteria bacterium CG10_big_fil_rev_8_21_14_0_10_42_12]